MRTDISDLHNVTHCTNSKTSINNVNEVSIALDAWRQVQKDLRPQDVEEFHAVPELVKDQPGFDYVLNLLKSDKRFVFCKLNHGFWERLALLEEEGIQRDRILDTPGNTVDGVLGITGSQFAEGGLLADLLGGMQKLAPPEDGMIFVPSLTPWPLSDRIEGTPLQKRECCESLIGHFVSPKQLMHVAEKQLSGHEFKVAAITGSMARLIDELQERDLILIANNDNRALFDAANFNSLDTIEIDATNARLERNYIRDRLFSSIKKFSGAQRPPVILVSAGGAMTTWLGFQVFKQFDKVQFVDLGGALIAYNSKTLAKTMWTKTYRRQLSRTVNILPGLSTGLADAYFGPHSIRNNDLIELALQAGVPAPTKIVEIASPLPRKTIPFIENKMYDHERIADFLSLSVTANHHANGGPVVALLELAVAILTRLPESRRVVAVNNGTAALHLACGYHSYVGGLNQVDWVVNAFNFFSSQVGHLANSIIIDSAPDGGLDIEHLKSLPISSYEGVIYTNIFAQQSNWGDVARFCRDHDKYLVIDNATGLFDRPADAKQQDAPMEIISAHHTKPWGVGEGGFIICNEEQEPILRQLANYASRLPVNANPQAFNYKISDLAAAAILDRMERMDYWQHYYKRQERRMNSLMIDADLGIKPLTQRTRVNSPRAHTPFVCPHPVDINAAKGPVTLRKYYKPLTPANGECRFPNAQELYARIFSLSNAPEMRLASNDAIIEQIIAMKEASLIRET